MIPEGLLMVVSKRWFEFCPEIDLLNLNLTSFYLLFYLVLTSFFTFFSSI